MNKIFSSRWFSLGAVLVIAASVLLAYSNTFHASFQFDDLPNIVDNPALKSLSNIGNVLLNKRGVTYATFALNYAAGGLDVFGYHAVNTAVHILNSVLIYFLLLATLTRLGWETARSRMIAFFPALLFALHPVQTQAVTYIIQRMESLSGTFYLASLMLFITGAGASTRYRRGVLYGLSALCYALGFYTKETAITLPAIVALYDFCFITESGPGEMFRKRWAAYGLLGALLVFFAITTAVTMGGFGDLSADNAGAPALDRPAPSMGTTGMAQLTVSEATAMSAGFNLKSISPKSYLFTEFNVLTYYFVLFLAPENQNLDYDFPVSKSLFETPKAGRGAALTIPIPPPAVSLAVLLVIIGLGAYFMAGTQKNRGSPRRVAAFFIFWFFIILSPTSSVVPIADVIYEHRVYLASAGFFTVFVLCVDAAVVRIMCRAGQ